MESSGDRYYDVSRRLLRMVGQWPYQRPREKLFCVMLVVLLVISVIVTQVAQFCICESTECIFQTLPPHMLAVMILVKLFTCQLNSRKIKVLTDYLFVSWKMFESQEEREIMARYAENGRWFAMVYTLYVYASTISFVTSSLLPRILDVLFPLNDSRPTMLVFQAYYFVDSEQYFYYIFCHGMISAGIAIIALIAHDCIFLTYIQHACGLFAVLGLRFEQLLYKRNIPKKSLIDSSDDIYCKYIASCIRVHNKTLRFAALLEDTFSTSFAVQLLIITTGLSITLMQVSMQLHDLTETGRCFLFIAGQLFHLFCLSLQGQRLMSHSLETYERIYNGSWYEIPVKSQKLLLFVMRRSMATSFITAGGMYIFSLENFTAVLQTSMSYFTMLLSFNEP